jgi:hypothetical protein
MPTVLLTSSSLLQIKIPEQLRPLHAGVVTCKDETGDMLLLWTPEAVAEIRDGLHVDHCQIVLSGGLP